MVGLIQELCFEWKQSKPLNNNFPEWLESQCTIDATMEFVVHCVLVGGYATLLHKKAIEINDYNLLKVARAQFYPIWNRMNKQNYHKMILYDDKLTESLPENVKQLKMKLCGIATNRMNVFQALDARHEEKTVV